MTTILFGIVQVLLGLHTLAGAVWKFSHSEKQAVPSLAVIPHQVWQGMTALEIAAGLGLVIGTFYLPLAGLVTLGAAFVAVEMLAFCAIHLCGGKKAKKAGYGPLAYWLAVAVVGVAIAGRCCLHI